MGTLSITGNAFQIDAVGANGHVCNLTGKIKGRKGYADAWADDGKEPPCVITFKDVPGGLEIIAEDHEACRYYCGARAGFESAYLLPPPGCTPEERTGRRNNFTALYQAQNYALAYESLNAYYNQCRKFLNWIESDEVRNDLAITQYHLGHKDECLRILQDTIGAQQTSEEQLSLPPTDLDNYLPVAKATWYNLKLCGKGGTKH